MQPAPSDKLPRIPIIDVARGLALVAMAIYHFAWDLEFFGYATRGMTEHGGWKLFARADASSFLFLVGVGLVLGHGTGIRWRPFGRRLAMIAAAAAAITVVTWFAIGEGFIFFGILHEIALASLFGLAFLRLPGLVTLAAAALVIVAPHYLRAEVFDHPAWWWLGLAPQNPPSNDYVPIFPWFGAVLAGIAVTTFARERGLLHALARIPSGAWTRPLVFLGRHSLAFYLIHQPVLIALVWSVSQVWPADTTAVRRESFVQACHAQCGEGRDERFCTAYCQCALNEVESRDMMDEVFGATGPETQARMNAIVDQCTRAIDAGQIGRENDE